MSDFPQIVQGGAAGASIVTSAIAGPATAAWAVPVIGAAATGVLIAWAYFKRRNAQKVAATELVDEIEPILAQNRDAYLAGPRNAEAQRAALAMFDDAWSWLSSRSACGAAELGSAGERCLSERAAGGRWDWFAVYRDPIAADKPASSLFPALPDRELGFLLPAALLAAAAVLS
jgi:hypothetical protein